MANDLPPIDPVFPQLTQLLDSGEMASVLGRLLRPDRALSSVRVRGLRYAPGSKLVVRYGVRLGGDWHGAVALASRRSRFANVVAAREAEALVRVVGDRTPAIAALALQRESRCLIQWLPLDVRLPALAEQPHRLRRRFRRAGVGLAPAGAEPVLLRYRPLQHASLRLGRHVVKIYASDASAAGAAAAQRIAERLPLETPRAEAVVPELRLTVQSLLRGEPPPQKAEVAVAAGALLSVLHGVVIDRPVVGPAHELWRVARAERVLLAIAPELRPPTRPSRYSSARCARGTGSTASRRPGRSWAMKPRSFSSSGTGRSLLEGAGAHVTGAVPHAAVPALLARADIALAPYAGDAPAYFSPLKLFEYLAAGLATIASDLPGVRDVVDEETAVVVPRGDSRALADVVARLAADRTRRERLGRAGRALVAAEHTWRHRADRILKLATEIAERPVVRVAPRSTEVGV